ncbi:MAG: DNA replication/repair protein RecF [Pseudomonadota bacterium]
MSEARTPALSIARLSLSQFRNHAATAFTCTAAPVVLTGPNGAGKTNILEAVSLLAPGQGLRRAAYGELTRVSAVDAVAAVRESATSDLREHAAVASDGAPRASNAGAQPAGPWAVAAQVRTPDGTFDIGTGLDPKRARAAAAAGTASAYRTSGSGATGGRIVRIDGEPQSGSGALAAYVSVVWLTPAMDGLFTGPAGERRRFLDRLTLGFESTYRTQLAQFERSMRARNRLLDDGVREPARFTGLEQIMAETGVAVAAARRATIAQLAATIEARLRAVPDSAFPFARLQLEGTLEDDLATAAAVDVEDAYAQTLQRMRERDRAAGRTLVGPHRSDLTVFHGPKGLPGRVCSTGEQKALLTGLILAQAALMKRARGGVAPLLLLDEVAAHLDAARRAALFDALIDLETQAWMTGTDRSAFARLDEGGGRGGGAQFFHVAEGGQVSQMSA